MSGYLGHPWDSARREWESLAPQLRVHGAEIGADARDTAAKGHDSAKLVVSRYTMLHLSFDPMTLILLKEAFGLWKTETGRT